MTDRMLQLDMPHGFASARTNYGDAKQAARTREAYEVMAKFFKATLEKT